MFNLEDQLVSEGLISEKEVKARKEKEEREKIAAAVLMHMFHLRGVMDGDYFLTDGNFFPRWVKKLAKGARHVPDNMLDPGRLSKDVRQHINRSLMRYGMPLQKLWENCFGPFRSVDGELRNIQEWRNKEVDQVIKNVSKETGVPEAAVAITAELTSTTN